MSMPFFLDILDSNNFRGHVKQPMGINEALITIKIQIPIPLVLFPICSCRISSIYEGLKGCLTCT